MRVPGETNNPPTRRRTYLQLVGGVSRLLHDARSAAARSVNSILTSTYWEIGRRIVEFEQAGSSRAAYGEEVLRRLASDLTLRFGRGFGLSNLKQIRRFYLGYPHARKGQTASGLSGIEAREGSTPFPLSWSHYVRLLTISESNERAFYEEEAIRGRWSVRELERQMDSMLHERSAPLRHARRNQSRGRRRQDAATPEEAIKDPYMLEFLGLTELQSERDLENALIDHMTEFLLELGCGFAFVARQKRLQVGTESYFLDLLFYHRGLRCLVAIDLKLGRFSPGDAGQMNLYLNCLREREALATEAPPIGLILCSERSDTVVRYALGGLANRIFASRYKLALPDPEVLTREVASERRRLEASRGSDRRLPPPGNPSA